LKNERNGGGVGPIEVFGIGHAIDFGAADIFGAASINHVAEIGEIAAEIVIARETGGALAAGYAGSENNFLADVNCGDFGADFGDFAGDIATGNVGQGDLQSGEAAADPEIEMIEGTGADADQDFVAAELRFGHVGETKNGGVPVFLEHNGFHERPPRSETYGRWKRFRNIVSR
jgi:hypothetical protein